MCKFRLTIQAVPRKWCFSQLDEQAEGTPFSRNSSSGAPDQIDLFGLPLSIGSII